MNLKQVIGKGMEYTPFVSIIPGSARIYMALHPNEERDSKVNKFVRNYLGSDSQSPNYSKRREICYGIIDYIPGLNLIRIPIDIINTIICKIFPCKKILTPTENLEKLKENLNTLQGWYQASEELKVKAIEQGSDNLKLYDIYRGDSQVNGFQKRTEDQVALTKEILSAFKGTHVHMKNYYEFPDEMHSIPFNAPFDPKMFHDSLGRILRFCSQNRLERRAFCLIDVATDAPEILAATYVRKYHKEMIDEVENQLNK